MRSETRLILMLKTGQKPSAQAVTVIVNSAACGIVKAVWKAFASGLNIPERHATKPGFRLSFFRECHKRRATGFIAGNKKPPVGGFTVLFSLLFMAHIMQRQKNHACAN